MRPFPFMSHRYSLYQACIPEVLHSSLFPKSSFFFLLSFFYHCIIFLHLVLYSFPSLNHPCAKFWTLIKGRKQVKLRLQRNIQLILPDKKTKADSLNFAAGLLREDEDSWSISVGFLLRPLWIREGQAIQTGPAMSSRFLGLISDCYCIPRTKKYTQNSLLKTSTVLLL